MGINLATVDSATQSIVDSIIDNGADDDGFLNYDVTLKASAVQTRIRMAWRGVPHTPSANIEYRFDNGVTVDPVSGMLVIPPGVSRFSLARSTRPEDSDEFLLDPQLNLNGIAISENIASDDIINAVKGRPPSNVVQMSIKQTSVLEGQRFLVTLTLRGSGRLNIPVKLELISPNKNVKDFTPSAKWAVRGALWVKGKPALDVPAKSRRVSLIVATLDDPFVEIREKFRLTIGGVSKEITIMPTAEVTKLTGKNVLEGGNIVFEVNLRKSNFVTLLPISAAYINGSKADVANVRNWRPNSGVRIVSDANGSRFFIPKGVTQFKLWVPTVDDNLSEPTLSMRLVIGLKSAVSDAFDDAEIASVTPANTAVIEGDFATFRIKLKKSNNVSRYGRYVQLSLADINNRQNANYADVGTIGTWRANNGVTLRPNGYFSVPWNVNEFDIKMRIKKDNEARTQYIQLKANGVMNSGKSNSVRIYRAAPILAIWPYKMASNVTEGGVIRYIIKFDDRGGLKLGSFALRLRFIYNSAYKFDIRFGFSSNIFESSQGMVSINSSWKTIIIRRTNKDDETFIILNPLSDRKYSAAQNAKLEIASNTFNVKVYDDEREIKIILGDLAILQNFGASHLFRKKRIAAQSIKTGLGRVLANEPLSKFSHLLGGVNFTQTEKIAQRLAKEHKLAVDRYTKYYVEAMTSLGAAYSALGTRTPIPRVGDPKWILENAQATVISWTGTLNNISGSIYNFAKTLFAYVGSTDPAQSEWLWRTDPGVSGLGALMAGVNNEMRQWVVFLDTEFNQLKSRYEQALTENQTQWLLNIISAVLSGIATLGSIGFLYSNSWAFSKQMEDFAKAKGNGRDGAQNWFSYSLANGVNGGAVFGSVTLAINNYYGMAYSLFQTSGFVEGFQYNPVVMEEAKKTYKDLDVQFASIQNKMNNFIEFFLRKGLAGEQDYVVETIDLSADRSRKQPIEGLIFEQEAIPSEIDEVTKKPTQYTKISWWNDEFTHNVTRRQTQQKWQIRFKTPVTYLPVGNAPIANQTVSPVVLDLSDTGLQFTYLADGALFDCDDDGQRDRTAWVAGGTALLAYDRDGDGAVTRTEEISFTRYLEGAKTDLEGLAFFDTNHDRVLDAHDLLWHQFGVWRDENGDGVSQPGEFVALDQAGIASISLISDHKASVEGDTLIYGRSHFTRTDGTIGAVGDVGFRYISAAA